MKKIFCIFIGIILVCQPLGAVTIYLYPNGVGDESNCFLRPNTGEANWEDVDENPHDSDTTYVFSALSLWKRDFYHIEDITRKGHINSVTVECIAREDQSTGLGYVKTAIKTEGGTIDEGTRYSLVTSYATYTETFTTNPETGNQWQWDELDDLQAGQDLYKVTGYGQARCTRTRIKIDYTFIPEVTILQ